MKSEPTITADIMRGTVEDVSSPAGEIEEETLVSVSADDVGWL